jgi:two-component system, LuxR family, response regulator FixJ
MSGERTVHVIDDDPAVRRSLERLLDAAGFKVISYATPQTFLDVAAGFSAGCVLVDLRMPEMNGLEVQSELARINPALPVIIVTGQGDVASAVRAMKAGAADFLEKPFTAEVLLSAIERTLVNWTPSGRVSPESEDAARRIATLSPRERQVLDALVDGRPNKVIAFDLGLSVRTVEVHRARMMDRLGVTQLGEAVRIAIMGRLASHARKG